MTDLCQAGDDGSQNESGRACEWDEGWGEQTRTFSRSLAAFRNFRCCSSKPFAFPQSFHFWRFLLFGSQSLPYQDFHLSSLLVYQSTISLHGTRAIIISHKSISSVSKFFHPMLHFQRLLVDHCIQILRWSKARCKKACCILLVIW